MNHIRQIEVLFSIILASFELQISTLHIFGGHRMRPEIIHRIKQLVQGLFSFIENTERELNDEIEGGVEQVLGHSAKLINSLDDARKEIPELQDLKEICKMAKSKHHSFTSLLAKEEQRMTEEVTERFAVMKKRVRELLSSIDRL